MADKRAQAGKRVNMLGVFLAIHMDSYAGVEMSETAEAGFVEFEGPPPARAADLLAESHASRSMRHPCRACQ